MVATKQQSVAQRFSQAASQYTQYDIVQRQSRSILLSMLNPPLETLLDVGCGPGTDFQHCCPKDVIALDIAQGMLAQLRQSYPQYLSINAAAEKLPLRAGTVDGYFSNLALQWSDSPILVAAEAYRVLRKRGQLAVAIVVDGSLPELQTMGLQKRAFHTHEVWQQVFSAYPWHSLSLTPKTHQCFFPEVRELLYSIKGVGASSATQASGLRGRGFWQALTSKAERLRQERGFPLSYQILYIQAVK